MKKEAEVYYDEGKNFLEKVKGIIFEAEKQGKKVVYVSDNLLIISLEEDGHTIYEVLDTSKNGFAKKLVYIGDKAVKSSYLLNLIHKQELKIDPYFERYF